MPGDLQVGDRAPCACFHENVLVRGPIVGNTAAFDLAGPAVRPGAQGHPQRPHEGLTTTDPEGIATWTG